MVEIFNRSDIQGRILILGEPGAGKTTELLYLSKSLLDKAKTDEQLPIPVILELSKWDGEEISDWLSIQLKRNYNLPYSTTQNFLKNCYLAILLDGLDELGLVKQQEYIQSMNQFLEKYETLEVVICCRKEEYDEGSSKLSKLNAAIHLKPLEEEQIRYYFEALHRSSVWETVKSNPNLLKLAQKPLFLFMLLIAYKGNPIQTEQELFEAYISKQLNSSVSKKIYAEGQEPTSIDVNRYLSWLAYQLDGERKTEFLIEEIQPNLILANEEHKCYEITVLNFNTYNSTVPMLGGLLCGSISGLGYGLIDSISVDVTKGLESGLIGFLIGFVIGWISNQKDSDVINYRMSFKWDSLSNGLLGGLLVGLVSGLCIGTINEVNEGLKSGFSYGLGAFVFFSLPFKGTFWAVTPIDEEASPNQGIRKGVGNAIVVGVSSGLILGLAVGISAGLVAGLKWGIAFGLLFGFNGGVGTAIKHFVLRTMLTEYGAMPWNYSKFLEYCVQHKLIQRTGGRYRFVHDLLRKYFAQTASE